MIQDSHNQFVSDEQVLWILCSYTHRKHAVLMTAAMEMDMGKAAFNQVRAYCLLLMFRLYN